jgi:Leucine-rich repeat (LRR) protein
MDEDLIRRFAKTPVEHEIEQLVITNQEIEEMANLRPLVNLRRLDLSHNKISMIEEVEKLKELRELNLQFNLIITMQGIRLPLLRELHLDNNKIYRI